jgi:hypothetical protein
MPAPRFPALEQLQCSSERRKKRPVAVVAHSRSTPKRGDREKGRRREETARRGDRERRQSVCVCVRERERECVSVCVCELSVLCNHQETRVRREREEKEEREKREKGFFMCFCTYRRVVPVINRAKLCIFSNAQRSSHLKHTEKERKTKG